MLLLELPSLVAIVLVAGLFARPLLEEWGFIESFNLNGLGSYPDLARSYPLRPLQGVPFGLQWLLSGGRPAGMSVGFAVVLVLKYLAARWAVSTVLPANSAYVVGMLALVSVPWIGQWHLRFSAPHLSAVFLFCALGAVLRLRSQLRWAWVVTGGLSVALVLATYQALLICCLMLPVVGLFADPSGQRPQGRVMWLRVLRCGAPAALGLSLYGVYAWIATKTLGSGYEGVLAGDSSIDLLSLAGLWDVVSDLYTTVYVNSPVTVALFGGILTLVLAAAGSSVGSAVRGSAPLIWLAIAVLLLPLLAMPYAVSRSFLADPERVVFPVSVGFVLIVVVAMGRYGSHSRGVPLVVAGGVGLALISSTALSAAASYRDYELQRDVLVQTGGHIARTGATTVQVRDGTGVLGDVYTLYEPIFGVALRARGVQVTASICTPVGTDRLHPVATRMLIGSTPRCEDTRVDGGGLVLDAHWGVDGIVIVPASP